jgi:hypothetical protein
MNNDNNVVFRSKVSRWIAGLYWGTLIFLAVMFIGISLFTPMDYFADVILFVTFFFIFVIILFTLYRAYRLNFIISKDTLFIQGLVKKHEIVLSEITDVRKVPIPFGFRLFGASFLGGRYYLPGVGNATVAMSNFDDGVLISTKKGYNYVITPLNPMKFIDDIKKIKKAH